MTDDKLTAALGWASVGLGVPLLSAAGEVAQDGPAGGHGDPHRRGDGRQANTVRVQNVPDPAILNRRDAIVKVTSTAICGSDLHLLDGYVPTMQKGDVLGHEFMGEVVEVGDGVDLGKLRVGDRVVVPFPIACGACAACRAELFSLCENSNPNAGLAEKFFGHPTAGIFGYSHLTGGFAGGQVRVRPGAVRRRGAAEDRVGPHRRAGAVPVRHPADRVHGRRDVRHPAG